MKYLSSLILGLFLIFSLPAQAVKNPSPTEVKGTTAIDAQQARELWLKGTKFIDPRSTSDWNAGRIPGALHMEMGKPVYNSDTALEFLGSYGAPVVAYCNAEACHRAAQLAEKLVEWGFTQVYYFRLGYPAWLETQSPFE